MGRKSVNTSLETRQLVIFNYSKGMSGDKIASTLNLSRSTVYDIISRFNKENRIESIRQPGRPEKLSLTDKRYIIRSIKKNPKLSAPALTAELNARNDEKVCAETVRTVIKSHGYNSRTVRSKPFISKINQQKRLQFAKYYISHGKTYWDDVIFADESKFNIFGSDRKPRVWRKPNTEFDPKHLNLTVKQGGGNVIVWGCFSTNGVGTLVFIDGNMNGDMYVAILKENLRQSAEKLGILSSFKFYQDNDPKHKARKTREWLLYNCPKVLETPPQSPDLNPIENLWDYLDKKIRQSSISSKTQLKERLQEEWNKIPPDFMKNLVSSMSRRLAFVIKAKGFTTKY